MVLFSTSSLPPLPVVEAAIDGVSDVVDFSNASFAFHYEAPCAPLEQLEAIATMAASKRVPLILSQLPNDGWQPLVDEAERLGIGWLHHRWLATDPELTSLRSAVNEAALSWCPDRGTFPQDASKCR